jgi:hypothetical protein
MQKRRLLTVFTITCHRFLLWATLIQPTSYFLKISFNIILPFTSRWPLFSFGFPATFYEFSISPSVLHLPPILHSSIWSVQQYLVMNSNYGRHDVIFSSLLSLHFLQIQTFSFTSPNQIHKNTKRPACFFLVCSRNIGDFCVQITLVQCFHLPTHRSKKQLLTLSW